ncbi:hypothetical protein TNIN_213951 [Trichonephila inaurata madagascariensis]|uniref:Uncharacterized protein n=1 Tax=Trichonephila inaurata madagascariensis TaxID=2747483 RepID=A0A8X7BMG4_9ARAC|nr:hypothetical protein TNIN_213951 [Trichonephila inaurata madagascariensis]
MGLFYALLPCLVLAVGVQSGANSIATVKQPNTSSTLPVPIHAFVMGSTHIMKKMTSNDVEQKRDVIKEVVLMKYIIVATETTGDNFIGLLNQGNPCSYNCYDSHKPCNIYEEYFPDGISCYTSNKLGQCIDGHCVLGESWITNEEESEDIDGSGVTVTETRNVEGPRERTATAISASRSSIGVPKSGNQVVETAAASLASNANGRARTSGYKRITKLGSGRISGAISEWGTTGSAIGEESRLGAGSEKIVGLIGISESGKEIDALPDEIDVLGVAVDWDNNRESGELLNYEEVYWVHDGESQNIIQ